MSDDLMNMTGASVNGAGRRIIAETIASRDKWWMEEIERLFDGYYAPTCGKCSEECYFDIKKCAMWQHLKQTIIMDKSMQESIDGQLIDRGSFAKYVDDSLCDSTCELYDGRICDVASNCNRRQAWKKLRVKK